MYKDIETMEDLEKAFTQVPNQLDFWVDCFWNLYSHGVKLRYRSDEKWKP